MREAVFDHERSRLLRVQGLGACRDAIARVVRPGDIVIDLSGGVGIQAILACRAGASRVHVVGAVPALSGVAAENGCEGRIVPAPGPLRDLELPARGDVLLAGMLEAELVGDSLFDDVVDARRRLLKPEARVVPERVSLTACPVDLDSWYLGHVDQWRTSAFGFSAAPARRLAVNTVWHATVPPGALLGRPAPLSQIDLAGLEEPRIAARASVVVSRPGVVHALAAWFEVSLVDGVHIGGSPEVIPNDRRKQRVFPLETPVPVEAGCRVDVAIRLDLVDRTPLWTWQVGVADATGASVATYRHSAFHTLLVGRETLAAHGADAVPIVGGRGQTAREIATLLGQGMPVADVAAHAWHSWPQRLSSLREAEVLVRRVARDCTAALGTPRRPLGAIPAGTGTRS